MTARKVEIASILKQRHIKVFIPQFTQLALSCLLPQVLISFKCHLLSQRDSLAPACLHRKNSPLECYLMSPPQGQLEWKKAHQGL